MTGLVRFVLYFIIFLLLFTMLRNFLSRIFGPKNINDENKTSVKKKKYEDIEEAKYIEIKPEDETKK